MIAVRKKYFFFWKEEVKLFLFTDYVIINTEKQDIKLTCKDQKYFHILAMNNQFLDQIFRGGSSHCVSAGYEPD